MEIAKTECVAAAAAAAVEKLGKEMGDTQRERINEWEFDDQTSECIYNSQRYTLSTIWNVGQMKIQQIL